MNPRFECRPQTGGPSRLRGRHSGEQAGGPSKGRDREAALVADSGIESRNRVVEANLRLVSPVAHRYVNRGLTIDDLIAEGNLGLIRAAESYDPSFGTRFSTYAVFHIREAIQSALANTAKTIRVPANVCKLLDRWNRTERKLWYVHGHQPSFDEVATAMGLDRPTRRLVDQAHRVARVRGQRPDSRGAHWLEWITVDAGTPAEDSVVAEEEYESISRRLERLERVERTVIVLHYGLGGEPPLSLAQIRDRLGITKAAISKLFSVAIRKLGGRGQVCA